MRHNTTKYIVIRRRNVLGYAEVLGPLLSNAHEVQAHAHRLFAKKDHTLEVIPWSQASKELQSQATAEPVQGPNLGGDFACMRGDAIFTVRDFGSYVFNQGRWRWVICRDGEHVGRAKTKKEAIERIKSGYYDKET